MKITIGLTRSNRKTDDYVPSMDGYRPGAAQDVVEIEIPDPELEHPEPDWQALQVAEAYFTATNAPQEVIERDELALAVYRAVMARHVSEPLGHRLTLSVGDTVEVGGQRLACESLGWKIVPTGE